MKYAARSLIETLPLGDLPPSSAVDALHLAAGIKQAMRTRLARPGARDSVAEWSERHGLTVLVDDEGFVCVAADHSLAELILEVDRLAEPHAKRLGDLLGYPACCSDRVERAGEQRIDQLAQEAAFWRYEGQHRFLDPSLYILGTSLICHVPCSPTCSRSLELARTALHTVREHRLLTFPVNVTFFAPLFVTLGR